MALASLIRNLKTQYLQNHNPNLIGQISNLRKRIYLIRNMQACGIASFSLCVICMLLLFNNNQLIAEYVFGLSLILLLISLYLSLREIQISIEALKIELSELESSTFQDDKKWNEEGSLSGKASINEAEKSQIMNNGLS